MSNHYEVGIIGAGIHGSSVAYHLGRAGARAVIFERLTPAAGPTGRSSAVCRAGYTNPFLAQMAHESIRMFQSFGEFTDNGACDYQRTGMLYLYRPDDSEALGGVIAHLRKIGIDIVLLDAEAVADEHPGLVLDDAGAAAWEADAGHADPAGSTRALFDDGLLHGVDGRTHTEIMAIEARNGGGAVLTTAADDRITCDAVLIAAGPWTAPLARQVGVDLPLTVERHCVATFAWGDAPAIPYIIGDVPGGYYLKPEAHGQYGLGSLLAEPEVDPDQFQEEVTTPEAMALAERAIRRVPALGRSSFAGGWASLYDVSPDWQPAIGEIADGIYVSAGTSGHGFKIAPALGREIAALVTGQDHDPGLAAFSPSRFSRGTQLAAGFGAARILG